MDKAKLINDYLNFDYEKIITYMLNNKDEFNIDFSLIENMNEQQANEFLKGEFLIQLWKEIGVLASKNLFKAQWGYQAPESFDHRHHLLDPELWCNDFWTMSANNVLEVMPYNAKVLDLCSGDGFYSYHFYSKRAQNVDCVEIDKSLVKHSNLFYQKDNITYTEADILKHDYKKEYYDIILIRGAIEHFNEEQQLEIFKKAKSALKPNGYFVGDTVEKLPDEKQLDEHEFEWASEEEMRQQLNKVFSKINTHRFVSHYGPKRETKRVSLFWQCQV